MSNNTHIFAEHNDEFFQTLFTGMTVGAIASILTYEEDELRTALIDLSKNCLMKRKEKLQLDVEKLETDMQDAASIMSSCLRKKEKIYAEIDELDKKIENLSD